MFEIDDQKLKIGPIFPINCVFSNNCVKKSRLLLPEEIIRSECQEIIRRSLNSKLLVNDGIHGDSTQHLLIFPVEWLKYD